MLLFAASQLIGLWSVATFDAVAVWLSNGILVAAALSGHGDGVCIRISDTGCGIDPSILPDLFEAFAQGDASIRRDHSGAGLGLALSGDLPPARVALDAEAA